VKYAIAKAVEPIRKKKPREEVGSEFLFYGANSLVKGISRR